MNILIAPNSYKECVDSVRIAQIIQREISKNSQVNLFLRPLSDGGDGFRSVYSFIQQVNTSNKYKIISYSNHLFNYLFVYSKKTKLFSLNLQNYLG